MKNLKFLSLFLLLGVFSLNAQHDVKVGDVYTFDDNSKGVVFYVDENGHGLAVSLNQEKRKWEDESHYVYCQDIVNIANETTPNIELNMGLGKHNTAFILQQLGDVKPTAAKYSREEGIEWYLPTVAEMYKLMKSNADNSINIVLKENGGDKIKGWYWTCSEFGQGEAWRINDKGKIKKASKLALRVHAKAIRQF